MSDLFVDIAGGELPWWQLPPRSFYDELFATLIEWRRAKTAEFEEALAGVKHAPNGRYADEAAEGWLGDLSTAELLREGATQHSIVLNVAAVFEVISRAFAKRSMSARVGRALESMDHVRWYIPPDSAKRFDPRYYVDDVKKASEDKPTKSVRDGICQLVNSLAPSLGIPASLPPFAAATFAFRDHVAHNGYGYHDMANMSPGDKRRRVELDGWLDDRYGGCLLRPAYLNNATKNMEDFARLLRLVLQNFEKPPM